MKKMISLLVALGVLIIGVGMPQAGSDRALCKQAIMSFIEAHGMQSDDNYNVVQLTEEQEREMRGLIRRGVASANKVADTFLDAIHHQLRFEFRNHLVRGWKLYLDGLETESPAKQIAGIERVQKWEAFKASHVDLLYKSIIE